MAPRAKKANSKATTAAASQDAEQALTPVTGKPSFKSRRSRISTPLVDITNQTRPLPVHTVTSKGKKAVPAESAIEAQANDDDFRTLFLKGQAAQGNQLNAMMEHLKRLDTKIDSLETAAQRDREAWPERAMKLAEMHNLIASAAVKKVTRAGNGNGLHEALEAIDEIKEAVDEDLNETYNTMEATQETVDGIEKVADIQETVDSHLVWFRHM